MKERDPMSQAYDGGYYGYGDGDGDGNEDADAGGIPDESEGSPYSGVLSRANTWWMKALTITEALSEAGETGPETETETATPDGDGDRPAPPVFSLPALTPLPSMPPSAPPSPFQRVSRPSGPRPDGAGGGEVGPVHALAPTNVYTYATTRLGLRFRPLDVTDLPQALAVYHPATRDLYVDDRLLGLDWRTHPENAWAVAVETTPLVRFLLAYCCAVQCTDPDSRPILLGFQPATERVAPEALSRYASAFPLLRDFLVPLSRLAAQTEALGLPVRLGYPEWRREFCARLGDAAADRALINTLAGQNRVPPILVEAALAGPYALPDWLYLAGRLVAELPYLALRRAMVYREFVTRRLLPAPVAAHVVPGGVGTVILTF